MAHHFQGGFRCNKCTAFGDFHDEIVICPICGEKKDITLYISTSNGGIKISLTELFKDILEEDKKTIE